MMSIDTTRSSFRPAWPVAVALVALQWVRPALLHEWVWLGAGGALFLAVWRLSVRGFSPVRDDELGALLFVGYLVHQFEEHAIDLFGRRYAFLAAANGTLGPALGCTGGGCPLTEDAVFAVNTLLVWWPLALAAVLGSRRPVLVAVAAGIPASNAVTHVVPALLGHGYNPGLVTGLLVFAPLVVFTWRRAVRSGVKAAVLAGAFAWGLVAHGLLLGMSLAVYVHGALPAVVYPVVMVLWGSVPWVVSRALDREGDVATA